MVFVFRCLCVCEQCWRKNVHEGCSCYGVCVTPRYRERCRLKWHESLNLRNDLENMGISMDGISERHATYSNSIRDDCWAVNVIRNYKEGKLIHWAWLSRGLVTVEMLAKWHFDGKVEDVWSHMERVRGGLRELMTMMDVSDAHASARKRKWLNAEGDPDQGTRKIWVYDVDEECPKQLPQWWSLDIEIELRNWCSERDAWDDALAARQKQGYEKLTYSKDTQYSSWLCTKQVRRVVFDMRSRTLIKNPAKMAASTLRKHGIAVYLKVENDAVWFQTLACSWKEIRCKLVPHCATTDAIPEELQQPHDAPGAEDKDEEGPCEEALNKGNCSFKVFLTISSS